MKKSIIFNKIKKSIMKSFDQFIGKPVIVRSNMAGVIVGNLKEINYNNQIVALEKTIKIYHWKGNAISVEDIAVKGISTGKLSNTAPADIVKFDQLIPMTQEAYEIIKNIKPFINE